ncbi:MAG: HDOD domain-containing protein [Candidatus Thiodiazotropha lotti]|nr:HDOD domain-containing protein [Candidatus Thiodiazotropha lotti]
MSVTSNELDISQAQSLVKGIDIPPRPTALQVVMTERNAECPDLGKIATTISADVSLSAGMLKTINSPLYGMRQKISSVQQAVTLLGFRTVTNLVTGISLRLVSDDGGKLHLDRFWDSASDVALLASKISRQLMIGNPEEAYTFGLFHDCGIPLLMRKYPDYIQVLGEANRSDELFTEVEERHYPTNHAVVGYYVANSWFIPKRICNAILNHHSREMFALEDQEESSLIALIHLAEHIVNDCRRLSDDPEWKRIGLDVLKYLDIDQASYYVMKEDLSCMIK